MEIDPDKKPWYQRPLPLPGWLPGWLLATLLAGFAFAGASWLALRGLTWLGAMVAFLCGAGFILAVLSVTAFKVRGAQEQPDFRPPLWIRFPILMAVLVLFSLIWVTDRRVTAGTRHGSQHVIAEGPAAVILGFTCMTLAAGVCVLMLCYRPRSGARIAASLIALIIIGVGLVYAIVRVVQAT